MLGHAPRTKSAMQILAELDRLYAAGWTGNVFFVDDNFIGNKRILKQEVLPALIEWRKDKPQCSFSTEVSLNLADDVEIRDMMVAAGFTTVFIGIETPDEDSLAECSKIQNRGRDMVSSIHSLHQAGLDVQGGFIVGFDSDKPGIFDRQIKFIQESGIVTRHGGVVAGAKRHTAIRATEPRGPALERDERQQHRRFNELHPAYGAPRCYETAISAFWRASTRRRPTIVASRPSCSPISHQA